MEHSPNDSARCHGAVARHCRRAFAERADRARARQRRLARQARARCGRAHADVPEHRNGGRGGARRASHAVSDGRRARRPARRGRRGARGRVRHAPRLRAPRPTRRSRRSCRSNRRAALASGRAIAATPGVDCLFIGPADLAASLGHLGDVEASRCAGGDRRRSSHAAKHAGIASGIFAHRFGERAAISRGGLSRLIALAADVDVAVEGDAAGVAGGSDMNGDCSMGRDAASMALAVGGRSAARRMRRRKAQVDRSGDAKRCRRLQRRAISARRARSSTTRREQGSRLAEFNYAMMLLNGEGGPADVDEGKKWLRNAADANMSHAQYVYGKMYDDGEFVETRPGRGASLVPAGREPGACAGGTRAGEPVPRRPRHAARQPQAFVWYKKAAEGGDMTAQYVAGSFYERGGDGVEQESERGARVLRGGSGAGRSGGASSSFSS